MFEEVKALLEKKDYSSIRKLMEDENVVDIAELFEELSREEGILMFRLLPKNIAADVFSYLSVEVEQMLIESLSDREIGYIIDDLFSDDAVDLLEEMPASIVKKVLKNANSDTRQAINHLLKYPEDSAGSNMTVEFVDLRPTMTIREAIRRIRQIGIDKETINTCYVIDEQRHLLGTVSSRQLLLNESGTLISDIMNENYIKVQTLEDQEEVAHTFQKYDLNVIPVVDNEERLVGIITVDDVVDILQEETTEDMEIMAAILPSEKPYMKTGVFETFKNRIPWLLLLMISATFTGKIIQGYEESLAACAVLTAFIPMLMDSGGNSGSQASVSVIRSISLGEVEFKDVPAIIFKEFRVSLLVGGVLGLANFLKILIVDRVSAEVALVVCFTLFATVIIAKFVGCTLPMLAKRLGFDPAIMASPFITTIVDALSLVIYFTIATTILHI